MTPRISPDRLLADIATLAAIGARPDGGVDRIAGSEADLAGRRWLLQAMRLAGLEARLDEVNNVFGHPPGEAPSDGWLLIGSHTDTVPAGGRLDGAYGVLAGLEVWRALAEASHPGASRIAVISFHNEEGVVPTGFDGSEHFCAGPHLDHIRGYLELHIEQGPRLEAEELELGVVDAIVGIDRYQVQFDGQANHAGTTPFSHRRDAGRAAARLLAGLRELVQEIDPGMVANVGSLTLEPGAPNVIPGRSSFLVEMRSASPARLSQAGETLMARTRQIGDEEGCQSSVRLATTWPAQALDPGYVQQLESVAADAGLRWRRLASGAGHDAEILARHVPAAMLFVPSRGGISHSPLEDTSDRLLALGCQALLDGALAVLGLPS